jgi:plastocyanin
MTSTGTNQTRLTTDPADDARPAYSPDGSLIVFQTDRDDPGQPACEGSGTCVYETYSMNASDGTGQTNFSDNISASDSSPDWESVSRIVTVGDFFFSPSSTKPALGGSVLWDFLGPTAHTATDDSGMGLFDSGTKSAGAYFVFRFVGAGNYPITCSFHPTQMSGTVKVPIKVAPLSGNQTTVFTVTWGAAFPPTGYRFDVQILRPGAADWADWKTNQTNKAATFVPDVGPGTYSFKGRLRKTSNGAASDYSMPVSITVT